MKTQKFNTEEVLLKIKRYCAYQERCTSEVKNKLKLWGLSDKETLEIIKELTELQYIDNLRYATLFASGRMHIKGWGKQKIMYALRAKQIDEKHIQEAISKLDSNDYKQNLEKQAEKWMRTQTITNSYEQKQKLVRYLLNKGYEYADIQEFLKHHREQ